MTGAPKGSKGKGGKGTGPPKRRRDNRCVGRGGCIAPGLDDPPLVGASPGTSPFLGSVASLSFLPPPSLPPSGGVPGSVLVPPPVPDVAVVRQCVPLSSPFSPRSPVQPFILVAPRVPIIPFNSLDYESMAVAPSRPAGHSMYRTLDTHSCSSVARQEGLYRSIEEETLQPQEHLRRALLLQLAAGPLLVCQS